MSQQTATRSLHLVLGTGGVRVLACAGAIIELEKYGYSFASVAGCSAGALVAALVAGGMKPIEIRKSLLEMDLTEAAGERKFYYTYALRPPFSLYKSSNFPTRMCELLGNDKMKMRDLHLPFAVAAVDINNLTTLIYSNKNDEHKDMLLSEVLSMAVAVPGLYPPYLREGRVIVDGAFTTQLNLALASFKEPEPTAVVLTCHISPSTSRARSIHEFLARTIEASIATNDEFLRKLLTKGEGLPEGTELPNVWWIDISCPDISYDNFSITDEQKVALFEAGRKAVEASTYFGGNSTPHRLPTPLHETTHEDRVAERTAKNAAQSIINYVFCGSIGEFNMDNSTNSNKDSSTLIIQSDIQNSNVAAAGSQISSSVNTVNNNSELAAFIQSLKDLMGQVAADQRKQIEEAIHILLKSIDADSLPRSEIAKAVETVASVPGMRERLEGLTIGTTGSLTASALIEAIKFVLG